MTETAKENNMKAKTVALSPEEANIRKLSRSPIPMNFVKKHNGQWNHQDWLDFLEYLRSKNYFPINTDHVGLLLEEKKVQYHAKQK